MILGDRFKMLLSWFFNAALSNIPAIWRQWIWTRKTSDQQNKHRPTLLVYNDIYETYEVNAFRVEPTWVYIFFSDVSVKVLFSTLPNNVDRTAMSPDGDEESTGAPWISWELQKHQHCYIQILVSQTSEWNEFKATFNSIPVISQCVSLIRETIMCDTDPRPLPQ